MNANELADNLLKNGGNCSWYKEIATMLRQQQAEIEALKAAKIRAYDNGVEDGRKPNTNNEPVAWTNDRELTRENPTKLMFRDKGVAAPIPLYTHPAELTDEEKWELFTNLARSPDLRADMIRFANAILRKAQENE